MASRPSSSASKPSQPRMEIPVWFSVFIGNPDPTSPRFDNARFDANISDEVFRSPYTNNSFERISVRSIYLEKPDPNKELSLFRAVVSLSLAFTDEIFNCLDGGCIVCQRYPAKSLIHRPLCSVANGYHELADFKEMHRLMSTIASHTMHITRIDEVNWSIGSFMSDKPYICALAMPVCSAEGKCYQIATKRAQEYIEGIFSGEIVPQPLRDSQPDKASTETSSLKNKYSDSMTSDHSSGTRSSSLEESVVVRRVDMDKPYIIGTTVFVGRPSLQIQGLPRHKHLSCLVLSSMFPQDAMPDSLKNEADAAIDYCRVAGHYEQNILQCADFRCVVCTKLVTANTLVHLPISFIRTDRRCLEAGLLRRLIMKICRFVGGKWTYPEMNAALGASSDAQVFELAVPICEPKSLCEEIARISAHEFLRLLLPSGMTLPFPGLDPDTELSAVDSIFRSFSSDQPEPAEPLVEKIANDCLISGEEGYGEDPTDSTLTVSKLRRWFEMCFLEEDMTPEDIKKVAYRVKGDSGIEDEQSEIDDSIIWVYDLVDLSDSSDEDRGDTESNARDEIIAECREKQLFQPVLTMDFWLLYEAFNKGVADNKEAHAIEAADVEDGYSSHYSSYEEDASD
ncbi:hypothetical protein EYZ11_001276 [Aspergillus tanneri]|uniref:Uncharacterized protein n=1 Tax=Aspergillus tanneri TaxID=1220188 RepID=A0A4S3JV57_9EURO|nr:uncharacterized protein ATNIH1004_007155 [Aspergillus tanneri]KAA8645736.1 hypothetical protein ATNIH1004_007155 [Aspergillus tanneri]THC99277.1 hypothetical protein EYZ11_001276 [Aspergillus tanneri]